MMKVFCVVIVVCSVALLGCSNGFNTYRADITAGRQMLDAGEYQQARDNFIKAAEAQPTRPVSYAMAATVNYKLNDLQAASQAIQEAAKRDNHSSAYIRILGYKALILLKQDREQEGLDALHAYIVAYTNEYGAQNVREVEAMWRKKQIDLRSLESLIDTEAATYESDIQQFNNGGAGWFNTKYGGQAMPTPFKD